MAFRNEIAEELVIAFAAALVAGTVRPRIEDVGDDFTGIRIDGSRNQFVELDAVVGQDHLEERRKQRSQRFV